MKLADLVVGIGANTKQLEKGLGKAMREMKYFGRNTKQLGKTLSMSITAPLAIMGATSVQAFRVQAKAIAQVEAGLKSTGNQVGYTSKQLQQMASDLQSKTLFGDEQILQDATAQLLTFTNISGDQFARTQQAALDLATRLDGDLKGASIQLGKALNDPVANLSALSRSGIQFSDEQKEVIKSMAETGRLAEAQTLILDELNKQYGGSAEAAAKADGGFTQLANAFGDLQEEIGRTLVPILTPLVQKLREMIEAFQGAGDGTKKFVVIVGLIAGAVGPLLVMIPTFVGALKAARTAMLGLNAATLANPFVLAAAAIAAIGVSMWALYDASTDAESEVKKLRDELNGMEDDEAARYVAQRIREQEEAVKKQREAVQALRRAANMGDATDRRIHAQTLARQEEVLANEEKKLDGYKREAFILEGQQQYADHLANSTQAKADAEADAAAAAALTKDQLREQARQMGIIAEMREMMREDILTGGPQDKGAKIDALPDELTGLETIPDMMDDFENDFNVDEIAFEKWQKWNNVMQGFKSVGESVFQSLAMNAASFGNEMGQAFGAMARGAEDGKERMKEATKGIINQALAAAQATIIEAMISSGKFSGPAAPIVIPALVAGGIGLVQSLFADIPAFADGGIISGPTVGLMGEYPGAKTNPEVIAPLDKLQSMLGAAPVVVTGKIAGNDIRLSNQRSERNAQRFLR
jgi:hypothetical protein